MKFTETRLAGAYVIETERFDDERGFFARSFCQKEFKEAGLDIQIAETNISFNKRKGILRGMHYQLPPKAQGKLVRCVKGAVYDVILDLRKKSPTYRQWISVELRENDLKMLYVPPEFAHGFQTLENDTEIFYMMTNFYAPKSARGIRWNDPSFNIQWPILPPFLSEKDRNLPDFKP